MHVVVLSRGLQSAAVLILHFLAGHHQCGYFNKASFSNRRILIILCSEMRNNHGNLLNHTTVHWSPHAKSHIFLLLKRKNVPDLLTLFCDGTSAHYLVLQSKGD